MPPSNFNSNSDYSPYSSKSDSHASFNPEGQTPMEKQGQFFGKDWRKYNPWMEGIEELPKEVRVSKPYRNQEKEEIKNRVGICINFGGGIPLDYFIECEMEKIALMKKKSDDLTVFNDMMAESRGIGRVVKNYDK